MSDSNGFLADGYRRARMAHASVVRAEVEDDFADRIANAADAELPSLRAEMERLIAERLNQLAPPDALY